MSYVTSIIVHTHAVFDDTSYTSIGAVSGARLPAYILVQRAPQHSQQPGIAAVTVLRDDNSPDMTDKRLQWQQNPVNLGEAYNSVLYIWVAYYSNNNIDHNYIESVQLCSKNTQLQPGYTLIDTPLYGPGQSELYLSVRMVDASTQPVNAAAQQSTPQSHDAQQPRPTTPPNGTPPLHAGSLPPSRQTSANAPRPLAHSNSSLSVSSLSLNRSNSSVVVMPYQVGDMIDCMDTMNKWLEARIAAIDEKKQQVYVNFEGWPQPKWHEWLHYKDKRIAKHYTHFDKPDKAYIIRQNEQTIDDTINRLSVMKQTIVQQILQQRHSQSTVPPADGDVVSNYYLNSNETLSTALRLNNTQHALTPIAELLSDADVRYVIHQQGIQSLSIILNGQLEPRGFTGPDDTLLLNKAVSCLRLLTTITAYALLSSKPGTLHNLWFEMLARLLGGVQSLFYSKYGTNNAERDTVTIIELTDFELDDKAIVYASRDTGGLRPYVGLSPQTSVYLIQNINLFGTMGGFDALLYHMTQQPGLSLDATVLIVHTLNVQRSTLVSDFVKPYIQSLRLTDGVQRCVSNMSDDVLKLRTDDTFDRLMNDTQSLLSLVGLTVDQQNEFIELSKLARGVRMINSGVLSSRLDGIAIVETTAKAIVKVYGIPTNGVTKQLSSTGGMLSPNRFVEWLDQHGVMQSILSKDSHEQVVKRSQLLLKFLGVYDKMDIKYIELLFTVATTTKAESMTRIVYELMTEIAQHLNDDHLNVIYTRFAKNIDKLRDIDINFVKNITKNAVMKRSKQKQSSMNKSMIYGTDILFHLVIQHGVHAQIAESNLAELLSLPELSYLLNIYIDKCLVELDNTPNKNVSAVLNYINLLQNVFASLPANMNKNSNNAIVCVRNEYIERISDSKNLIDLVVNDLLFYHTMASKQQPSDADADLIVQGVSHQTHISTRFRFLTFLLNNSNLVPKSSHFDQLNHIFVLHAIDRTHDSNLLFQYLTVCVDGKSGKIEHKNSLTGKSYLYQFGEFPFKLHRYIFEHIVCNTENIPYFTEITYSCFESYFVYINFGIDNLEGCQRSQLSVLNYKNLIGVEYFFNIAINCIDSIVSSHASFFLISCFLRLDRAIKNTEKKQFLFMFIDKCMNELMTQIKQNDTVKMKRIVDMLNKFLTRLSQGELPELPFFTVNQKCKYMVNNKQMVNAKIAVVNRDNSYTIKLTDQNNVMEYSVPERLLQSVDRVNDADKSIVDEPKNLLSTKKVYYDTLYNLLDQDDDQIKDLTLNILHRVPMNSEYMQRIDLIEKLDKKNKIDWPIILPKTNNKLHFLIDTIKLKIETSDSFCIGFIANNGLTQLFNLIDVNANAQSAVFQSKLTNILTISSITYIVSNILSQPPLYKAAVERIKEQSIVEILLSLCCVILHNIDTLNLNMLDEQTLSILHNSVNSIVSCMFSTIDIVLKSNASLIPVCAANTNWVDIVQLGILNKQVMIRKTMNMSLVNLLNSQPQLITTFLNIMYDTYTKSITIDKNPLISEYFDLYKSLYETYYQHKQTDDNVVQVNHKLLGRIAHILGDKYPIVEKSNSPLYVDNYLNGTVLLLVVLIQNNPAYAAECDNNGITANLLSFMFNVPTIAELDDIHPPHMKTEVLRTNTFILLKLLSSDKSNQLQIISKLQHYHDNAHSNNTALQNYNFYPRMDDRAAHGFAGISNLGCVCYMIAPLQNLYMIPQLRKNIFAVNEFTDIYQDENNKKSVEVLRQEQATGQLDSLVYQMQYMFASLQESDEQAYNPLNFVTSFKDEFNKPTDVRVQDDSGSFVQKLLDRLNMALKTTNNSKNGISDVLGGVLAHDLIGKDTCKHKRTREEEFFGLQVEVENQRSLYDSLQSYISTELLEGSNAYRCDECNAKVSTIKRVSIQTLPQTLFFVLKRFALDYNTMETVKINEKLTFPMTLNMKQFTKQYVDAPDAELDDTPFQYELRGIVVHTGSAQGGHYYSFIQDRASKLWYKYNDSIVTEFDPADIADECFGGFETISMNLRQTLNESNNGGVNQFEKFRNAYILFYDKVDSTPVSNTQNALTKAQQSVDRLKCPLPTDLSRTIHEANVTAWLDKMVYDASYMDFLTLIYRDVNKATQLLSPEHATQAVHLANNFLLNTVARSHLKQKYFLTWITITNRLYVKYSSVAYEYVVGLLAHHSYWLEQYSLHCNDSEVRQNIGTLLAICVRNFGQSVDYSADVLSIGEQLAAQWAYMVCQLNWSEAYWKLLQAVCTCQPQYAFTLTQKHNLLGRLIDFYLGEGSSLANPQSYQQLSLSSSNKSRGRLGLIQLQRIDVVPWITVLKLLRAFVVCYQQPQFDIPVSVTDSDSTDAQLERKMSEMVLVDRTVANTTDISKLIPLDPSLKTLITTPNRALGELEPLPCTLIQHADAPAHARELKGIYTHWCRNNQGASVLLIKRVVADIQKHDYTELRPQMRVIQILCTIDDALTVHRVDWVLDAALQAVQTQGRYWKLMDFCTEHLIRLAKNVPAVKQWMFDHTPYVRSLLMYMEAHPTCPIARTKYASMGKDEAIALKPTNSTVHNVHHFGNIGLSSQAKIECLQALVDKQELSNDVTELDSEVDVYDRQFTVGEWVDCQDQVGKWLCAQVVSVDPGRVHVKYSGYINSYEWIPAESTRLMPLGTHTTAIAQSNRMRQASRDSSTSPVR